MKIAMATLCCAASLFGQAADDPWKALSFLEGSWEARTKGGSAGADASGVYSFQFDLKRHVLARYTAAGACTGPKDFDCQHGDLLYVYQEAPGAQLKAIYFDNEGHVIHYNVSAPDANTAVFLSEAGKPGPQYRLIYERKGATMSGKFEMRMPGDTAWKAYLEWSGSKK
jgi:hypothetical protein